MDSVLKAVVRSTKYGNELYFSGGGDPLTVWAPDEGHSTASLEYYRRETEPTQDPALVARYERLYDCKLKMGRRL